MTGFGIAHAAVFATGDIEDLVLVWGIAFGLAHALISGMMLTMMPAMHPEMRSGRMEAPGFMALGLGIPTGMGVMMLHGVFGAPVGVLYSVWIQRVADGDAASRAGCPPRRVRGGRAPGCRPPPRALRAFRLNRALRLPWWGPFSLGRRVLDAMPCVEIEMVGEPTVRPDPPPEPTGARRG